MLEMNNKNMKTSLSVYHVTIEEDLHLWKLWLKTVLRRMDMIEAFKEGSVDKKTSKKALLIIHQALVIVPSIHTGQLFGKADCNILQHM